MLLDRPTGDVSYAALVARDPAYDGFAHAAVTTTGVFCRLTCAAIAPGLADPDLIARLCAALSLPVNIETGEAAPAPEVPAGRGVARISHGPSPHFAAMAWPQAQAAPHFQPPR